MLAFSKNGPALLRRLLFVLAIVAAPLIVGELFGRVWRSNVVFVEVLSFSAWWLFRLSEPGEPPPVLKPAREWVTTENVFDWSLLPLGSTFYVVAVVENFRAGVPDIAPGLSTLGAPLLLLLLRQHIVKPPPSKEPRRFF